MSAKLRKILSLVLTASLLFQQVGFAQIATELNVASYLSKIGSSLAVDKFRPLHLRYFSYDSLNDNFKVLLDKGDLKNLKTPELESSTKTLLSYFLIGVTLPDNMFWVNLRPDSENQIIDQYLEKTDIGKIMLEADLQLKKDTAAMTSPQTPEGREYWDKLYKKASELYGYDNVTIPTLTRPWIVPGEIIVRESKDSAYVYKATLKVMLEQDYLKDSTTYNFKDERVKALNEYSSQLIRELIISKLTKEVNSSKRYAPLRQVYYSLILSRWFKLRFTGKTGTYASLINTKDLTNLISKDSWSKTEYFNQYKKSFQAGEYNIKESVYTPTGQVIRSYFSGGIDVASSAINTQNGIILINDNANKLGDIIGGKAVVNPQSINLQPAVAASPILATLKDTLRKSPNVVDDLKKMDVQGQIEKLFPDFGLFKKINPNGKLSPHTWDFLKRLEQISKNDVEGINQAKLNFGSIDEAVVEKYYKLFHKFFGTEEGREFIFLTALLHDIGCYEGIVPGHEALGEQWIRKNLYSYYSKDFVDKAAWLIGSHIAIGGLFFGERTPQYLLKSLEKLPQNFHDELLAGLAIFTFCDAADKLNNIKANFYYDASSTERVSAIPGKFTGGFLEYRLRMFVSHFSGESLGKDYENKILDVFNELGKKEKEIFARQLNKNLEVFDYGLAFTKSLVPVDGPNKGIDRVEILMKALLIVAFVADIEAERRDVDWWVEFATVKLKDNKVIKIAAEITDREAEELNKLIFSDLTFEKVKQAYQNYKNKKSNSLLGIFKVKLGDRKDSLSFDVVSNVSSSPVKNSGVEQGITPLVYPYSAFSIPLISDASTLKAIEDHMLLVQAGKTYKNGKALVDRYAALTNWMWTDLLRDKDDIGVKLHQEKLSLTAEYNAALKRKDFKTAREKLQRYVEIRDLLCKRWLSLAIDAEQGKSGLPKYAYEYARKVFSVKDYELVAKLYRRYGDNLRNMSLYTWDPIAELVQKANAAEIALFPLGAGGPGTNIIAASEHGVVYIKNFLEENGINQINEDEARAIIRGDEKHRDQETELKGYLPFKIGIDPMKINGFAELKQFRVNLPEGPKEGVFDQQAGRVIESAPGETIDSNDINLVKGLLFMTSVDQRTGKRVNFDQGKPLDVGWVKSRIRFNADQARGILQFARDNGIKLEVIAHLRGVDGCGSSLDLPEFQLDLTQENAKMIADFPSTPTIASEFTVRITFDKAGNPDEIVYEAPDYFKGSYRVANVDLVNHPDPEKASQSIMMPKNKQKDAPAYILKNIFGLSGIKVTCESISPMALAGGMESSNAFNVALIAAASMLSGADLNYADIFNLAVKLENDELNGLTGGQGHLSSMLGGAYHNIWLSGIRAKRQFTSSPLEEAKQDLLSEGQEFIKLLTTKLEKSVEAEQFFESDKGNVNPVILALGSPSPAAFRQAALDWIQYKEKMGFGKIFVVASTGRGRGYKNFIVMTMKFLDQWDKEHGTKLKNRFIELCPSGEIEKAENQSMDDLEAEYYSFTNAIVEESQVRKAGCDWGDVKKNLIENGWAEERTNSRIRLTIDYADKETVQKMEKIFGNDFSKISHLLRKKPNSEAYVEISENVDGKFITNIFSKKRDFSGKLTEAKAIQYIMRVFLEEEFRNNPRRGDWINEFENSIKLEEISNNTYDNVYKSKEILEGLDREQGFLNGKPLKIQIVAASFHRLRALLTTISICKMGDERNEFFKAKGLKDKDDPQKDYRDENARNHKDWQVFANDSENAQLSAMDGETFYQYMEQSITNNVGEIEKIRERHHFGVFQEVSLKIKQALSESGDWNLLRAKELRNKLLKYLDEFKKATTSSAVKNHTSLSTLVSLLSGNFNKASVEAMLGTFWMIFPTQRAIYTKLYEGISPTVALEKFRTETKRYKDENGKFFVQYLPYSPDFSKTPQPPEDRQAKLTTEDRQFTMAYKLNVEGYPWQGFFEEKTIDNVSVTPFNAPKPYGAGHVVLIPRMFENLPQKLTEEAIKVTLRLMKDSEYNQHLKIGFNGLRAWASTDQLHLQTLFFEDENNNPAKMPVETSATKNPSTNNGVTISELDDYPATGFVFESQNTVALITAIHVAVSVLQNTPLGNLPFIPHNFIFTKTENGLMRVFLFPRKEQSKEAKYEIGAAFVELGGILQVSKLELVDRIKEDGIDNVTNEELKRINLEEEDFRVLQIKIKDKLSTSSSMIQENTGKVGGIDFRALPMTIQPMGSFNRLNFKLPQLSQAELRQINIDSEIQQIKNMVQSRITPSGQRIKELIAACVQKKMMDSQVDNLLLCLADIFKLEEENASESSPELREALVIVDSQS